MTAIPCRFLPELHKNAYLYIYQETYFQGSEDGLAYTDVPLHARLGEPSNEKWFRKKSTVSEEASTPINISRAGTPSQSHVIVENSEYAIVNR